MSHRKHLENLVKNHRRRLHILREKKALSGSEATPALLIEIQDIEAEIENLQSEIQQISDYSSEKLYQNVITVSDDPAIDTETASNVKGKVLIIDDDPEDIWQDTIAFAFQDRGYETVAVSDIKSAKAALKSREFDIVTIDMQLTEDEEDQFLGERILDIIVRKYPNTACIVISGSVKDVQKYKNLQRNYGLTAFIPKLHFGDAQNFDLAIRDAEEDVKRRMNLK